MKSAWTGGCVGGWTDGRMDDLPTLCRGSKKELLWTGETQVEVSDGPTRGRLHWMLVLSSLGGCLQLD